MIIKIKLIIVFFTLFFSTAILSAENQAAQIAHATKLFQNVLQDFLKYDCKAVSIFHSIHDSKSAQDQIPALAEHPPTKKTGNSGRKTILILFETKRYDFKPA